MELCLLCPNCNDSIIINEKDINCAIFRHGVYKNSYIQMNSHETKETCDKLLNNNEIYGCGKPFCLVKKDNNYIVEICDYI